MATVYTKGVCIPPPFGGAPGPPFPPSYVYMKQGDAEDEEELLMVHSGGPDDLGDLMLEMREGAAWAEGLGMDCDPPPPGAPAQLLPMPLPQGPAGPPAGSTLDLAAEAAAAEAEAVRSDAEAAGYPEAAPAAAPSVPPAEPLDTLLSLLLRQQTRGLAAGPAAACADGHGEPTPPLKPAVRALLMHPGAPRDGGLQLLGGGRSAPMVPVAVAQQLRQQQQAGDLAPMSCAAALAASGGYGAALAPMGARPFCPWPPSYGGQAAAASPPPFYPSAPSPPLPSSAMQQQQQRGAPAYYMPQPQLGYVFCQPAPAGSLAATGVGPLPPQQAQQRLQSMEAARLACFAAQQAQQDAGLAFQVSAMPPLPTQANSSACGSGDGSDDTTQRLRSSMDSMDGDAGGGNSAIGRQRLLHDWPATACGQLLPLPQVQLCGAGALPMFGQQSGEGACFWDEAAAAGWGFPAGGEVKLEAPSDSSDVEDGGGARLAHQHSQPQVVPNAAPRAGRQQPHILALAVPCGDLPSGPLHSPFMALPPLPSLPPYYDTPTAHNARMARHASLQRYREKKARRGFGKKIRYQARKVNADKRPRIKGRFVKAGEAADMLAAAALAAADAAGEPHIPSASASPAISSG